MPGEVSLDQGGHQPLSDGPVGGLAEITTLRMLLVRAAGEQRELHVGDGDANEHAQMLLLGEMRQDEPLPVAGQHVFGTGCGEGQSAARLARLQQHVRLGVVS